MSKQASRTIVTGLTILALFLATTYAQLIAATSPFPYTLPGMVRLVLSTHGILTIWVPTLVVALGLVLAEVRYRQSEAEGAQRALRNAKDYLSTWLLNVIPRVFPGQTTESIRANVMIQKGGSLKVVCHCRMETHPDVELSWERNQGACGHAWDRALVLQGGDRRSPVVFRRDQADPQDLKLIWRLTDRHVTETALLKWVISTPVFRTRKLDSPFMAILNFDGLEGSLNDLEVLRKEELHQKLVAWANEVAGQLLERGIA